MTNDELYGQALTILGLSEEDHDTKNETIENLTRLAQARFALAVPEMLTDEQVDHMHMMQNNHRSAAEVMKWAEEQLPVKYREIFEALFLDAAEEVATSMKQVKLQQQESTQS